MSDSDCPGDGAPDHGELSFWDFFLRSVSHPSTLERRGERGSESAADGSPEPAVEVPDGSPEAENEGSAEQADSPKPEALEDQGDDGETADEGPAAEPDYKVGYKNPPLHSRFRKNQSGNPGGKKPGMKSHAAIVTEILGEKVEVKEGGRRRRMSRFEFSLRRVVEKAMKGDAKSLQLLLAMMQTGEVPDRPDGYRLTQDDKNVLDGMAARMRRSRGGS